MSGKIVGYRYRSKSDSISLSVLQSRANFKNFKNFFFTVSRKKRGQFRTGKHGHNANYFDSRRKTCFCCLYMCAGMFSEHYFLLEVFFFCFFSIACSNCLPRRRSEQWAHHATDSSLYHRSKEHFSLLELYPVFTAR